LEEALEYSTGDGHLKIPELLGSPVELELGKWRINHGCKVP
jgi:hypothetical protein